MLLDTSASSTGLLRITPAMTPTIAAIPVSVSASVTNCHEILAFDEPIALSTPISRRRSRTIISMLRKMITEPATSAPMRL